MGQLTLCQGGEIDYHLIMGETQKPCLVFLHEGLGCTAMWKDFPERLCRQTSCPGLLYDRRGYGRSSGLNSPRRVNYLHEYALIELPQVIAALIPHRSVVLIGHSDGGSISLIYASQKPQWLLGVISEAAHVFVDPKTLQGIQSAIRNFQAGRLDALFKYHGDKTAEVFAAWHQTWLSPWFRHWSIEYVLPSIECPVMILQGIDDPYGTKAQVDAIASGAKGPCRMEMIENCGHAPHSDQAGLVGDLMTEFIASILPDDN